MLEKMQDVKIPWGEYHTMVKKLEFLDGEYFIGKFVRNSDGLVSWHLHESETRKVVTKVGVISYEKGYDSQERDEQSLKAIIKNFEQATHVEFATLI